MNQSESVLESPDMYPQPPVGRQLILASNSPRRKELMSLLGLRFTVLPVEVDETPLAQEAGIEYVTRIAESKSSAAAHQVHGGEVIVTADTAVVNGTAGQKAEILGKPTDPQQAVVMLRNLRGHTHQVFTALSIIDTHDGKRLSDLCATDVPMRHYSNEEIAIYVAGGDPMDKAGAYAIQHSGFHPVDQLHGCFANVMGLPLCHLVRSLSRLGISPANNVPLVCQDALKYRCPVYHLILRSKSPDLVLS